MQPTKILMEEHRVIERFLDILHAGARRLGAGEALRPGFFLDAADFIREFADGCHHRKEEGILFPAMEAAGFSRDGGPIAVMLAEHEEGRRLAGGMRAAAETLQAGDPSAAAAVIENAEGYFALMRQHILKENNILFPMADRAVRAEQQAGMAEAFERAELEETGAGVHDKYLALADALAREAGGESL